MAQPHWRVPRKRKGEALAPVTVKLSQAFRQALREYAALESQPGRKISQGTILETLALRASPELRQLLRKHGDPSRQST